MIALLEKKIIIKFFIVAEDYDNAGLLVIVVAAVD
jgi:hypothetical protein